MTTKKNRSKKTTTKRLYKLNGGGNNELTQSMRYHPTYRKPNLKLVTSGD
jgi:hypothetical protein